jgi:hypothetical protein
VDVPLLSCKQQVGGSSPPASSQHRKSEACTLAYGLLTALLGLGYAAVALGLGGLLGRDSSLVVAAATLAVAAVFQSARRRIQAVVDRRFNRRRHDAAQVIEGFGPACATRSTWPPSPVSCCPWSTRPCSPTGRRCGCGRRRHGDRPPGPPAAQVDVRDR